MTVTVDRGGFCGEEGWGGIPQPSLTSNVGRRTVWGGVPPEDQPLRCCGSQGGRPSIIPPACQRDASLGQRGVAFFFCFLHDLQSMLRRRCPKSIWIKVRPLSPLKQQGALRRGGVMSQGHDATSKMLRPRKPPSRSISTPLVCTAGTSSASLDNRRRGSLVWAWSGCKCTAAQTLRQVSDVGSGRPHICKSGLTTLRQPFHGAEAAGYALDTVSNSLGQFSTSSCCGWRLKRTAPRA